MPSRYQALTDRLSQARGDRVTLTFAEIELLVGKLPASARRYRAWWGNEPRGHVQAAAWIDAGYRVVQVKFDDLVAFAPLASETLPQESGQSDERVIQLANTVALGGDSVEQRAAEALLVAGVAEVHGVKLVKGRRFIGASIVELDGICDEPPVLVEAWAHQGRPLPAQKNKVMADALKLVWVDKSLFEGRATKILALADTSAAAHFTGSSWMASALRDLRIEVVVVELPGDIRERIRRAQRRQALALRA